MSHTTTFHIDGATIRDDNGVAVATVPPGTGGGKDLLALFAAAPKMRGALKGALELSLQMGTIIRNEDEEGHHTDFWTNDGDPLKKAGGRYVPDERFHAIEEALAAAEPSEPAFNPDEARAWQYLEDYVEGAMTAQSHKEALAAHAQIGEWLKRIKGAKGVDP